MSGSRSSTLSSSPPIMSFQDLCRDGDVILILVPISSGATSAVQLPENRLRFQPRLNRMLELSAENRSSRDDRASTAPPDDVATVENTDSFVLRFSHGAKNARGVIMGRSLSADLLITGKGISTMHAVFNFNERGIPFVQDLGSRFGTRVIYPNDQSNLKGFRKGGKPWLLTGPPILNKIRDPAQRDPILYLAPNMAFRVHLPYNQDRDHPDWRARVNIFRERHAEPSSLFGQLDIGSASTTQPATGQVSPAQGPGVIFRSVAGRGIFGVVTYVWNSSTNEEHAEKRPFVDEHKLAVLRDEVRILQGLDHPNIVKYKNFFEYPKPTLVMEWVHGKPLSTDPPQTTREVVHVLHQLCLALEYLDACEPPVAHRDIKGDNVMVTYHGPDHMSVKLIDFGLAKAAEVLTSYCGNLVGSAPEVFLPEEHRKYNHRVDIWSTGVLIAEIIYPWPMRRANYMETPQAWCAALIEFLQEQPRDDVIFFVLDNMLIIDQEERSTADYLAKESKKLFELPNKTLRTSAEDVVTTDFDSEAGTFRLLPNTVLSDDIQPKDALVRLQSTIEGAPESWIASDHPQSITDESSFASNPSQASTPRAPQSPSPRPHSPWEKSSLLKERLLDELADLEKRKAEEASPRMSTEASATLFNTTSEVEADKRLLPAGRKRMRSQE